MKQERIGISIASMVLGIIAVPMSLISIIFMFFIFPVGMILVLISLVCGIIAIVLGNKSRPLNRGTAGLVLGIIATSLAGCIIVMTSLVSIIL